MKEYTPEVLTTLVGLLAIAAVAVPLAWRARLTRRLREGLIGEIAEGVIEDVAEQTSFHFLAPSVPDFLWLHCRYEVPGKGMYRGRYPYAGPCYRMVNAIGQRVEVRYLTSSPHTSVLIAPEGKLES